MSIWKKFKNWINQKPNEIPANKMNEILLRKIYNRLGWILFWIILLGVAIVLSIGNLSY